MIDKSNIVYTVSQDVVAYMLDGSSGSPITITNGFLFQVVGSVEDFRFNSGLVSDVTIVEDKYSNKYAVLDDGFSPVAIGSPYQN